MSNWKEVSRVRGDIRTFAEFQANVRMSSLTIDTNPSLLEMLEKGIANKMYLSYNGAYRHDIESSEIAHETKKSPFKNRVPVRYR